MATPDHNPCLKQVLRICQHAAMTSLHGPGPNYYLNDMGAPRAGVGKLADPDDDPPSLRQLDAHTKHELYTKTGFKKLLLYEESRKNKVEESAHRGVVTDSTVPPPVPAPTATPATHTPSEPSPPKGKDVSTSTSVEIEDSWIEPGVFLAPPPFPPQPVPVLAIADKGSPGAVREETLLDGEVIACFSVGGEKRLCMAQILNTVLREFSLTQINPMCDELQIYCSRCNPAQLDSLRNAGVLPHSAISCGLITYTDAQRLTQALLYTHPVRAPIPAPTQRPDHPQLRVYHTCFGKCKGVVWEDLYTGPDSPCIECEECRGLLPPARFVCHAHRSLENRTVHWGFDAEQWRTYLLLAKDQHLPLEKAEGQLKAFKNKFGPAGAKRKQHPPVQPTTHSLSFHPPLTIIIISLLPLYIPTHSLHDQSLPLAAISFVLSLPFFPASTPRLPSPASPHHLSFSLPPPHHLSSLPSSTSYAPTPPLPGFLLPPLIHLSSLPLHHHSTSPPTQPLPDFSLLSSTSPPLPGFLLPPLLLPFLLYELLATRLYVCRDSNQPLPYC
ncbi:hypothetical protein Pmani_002162 [Petrolisthes manimaculis]|uniref:c-SKI SMAD4-binding domain-containing protein n=1 Tax=Petrolisthes manimaculis TaxID=1843537 RepID=A0AAE1QJ56_9EUCA|nr:hypothetical protein Pmani_009400 [Petrolisthes manimaculis]KAK4327370.1 hypothetical protein Pmani_002162 [Petrolisthes manimaculis]